MYRIVIFLSCLMLLLQACSRKSVSALARKNVIVTRKSTSLNLGSSGKSLQLQYLGCGGLYLRHAGEAILFDPYFSNQRIGQVAKSALLGGKMRSKPKKINFAKQRILDSLSITETILADETKAIFVAHGHYDHLMDVPYVFQYWFKKQPDIYLSSSSFNTISNAVNAPGKLHNAESIMSVRDLPGQSIDFPAADGSVMKVYPIQAAHNPHSLNIKFFSGSVMCPLPHFKTPESKTHANDWLEGRILSFLVDIEQSGSIVFRLFIQSSSCHFPDGMPPNSLLARRPVDLAVLGVASYHFSEATYPCTYLDAIQAKKVMYIHWEDFFRNYKRRPKSVLATDLPRFFNKIEPTCKHGGYILPSPGVVTTIQY